MGIPAHHNFSPSTVQRCCSKLTGEMNVVLSSLHVSRPGLWLVTVWLYLISVGGERSSSALMSSTIFWGGLLYCTYPLNLLVYAMNDLDDVELDKKNPRKGKYLVGSDADNATLRTFVCFACLLTPALLCVLLRDLLPVVASALFIIGSNYLYNLGPRWRAGP